MADDVITAREIRLIDDNGNVAAVLIADTMEDNQAGAVFKILDKARRQRARVIMTNEDPGPNYRFTILEILDDDGEPLWCSMEPVIGG